MTTPATAIQPGDIRTRDDIRPVLGGSPYGGICPSREKKTVVLFSDINSGEQYGYRDGWLAEEDDLGPVFTYTGAGKKGHQTFDGPLGSGNSAIRNHAVDGRTLHLFIAAGWKTGTAARTHRYIGAFRLDLREPYRMREALDENRSIRNVIVFRLRPVGSFHHSATDVLPPAEATMRFFNRAAARLTRSQRRQRRVALGVFTAVEQDAQRRDDLSEAYDDWATTAGRSVGQLEVAIQNKTSTLQADLYDEASNTVIEPTGNTSREALRLALAQLLDIGRYLRQLDHQQPLRLMVLAPELPDDDVRGLLEDHNVGIIYRNASGNFSEVAPPRRGIAPGNTPSPCAMCPALT
ncbi:hypothetical protein ACIBL6_06455 [Streptomyces sp. NPDC050400]|uniref:hypothetical protein n=1 Tax=Streptomyces sp. NPDC050400 TaxID=3365610 RepID=UPI0037B7DF64